ncbi:MAG: hypothetical protein RML84_09080 [Anaerolineae bacterium]|nr:hypothetical protein [Anaerolineae bacterium]
MSEVQVHEIARRLLGMSLEEFAGFQPQTIAEELVRGLIADARMDAEARRLLFSLLTQRGMSRPATVRIVNASVVGGENE